MIESIEAALLRMDLDRGAGRILSRFIELFEKWNSSINLSAASSRAELVEHVVDSLHVVPYLRDRERVLDVGSGGGFPVVIAAVCLPGASFTALEPVHKKHAFLRTAARELSLPNLTALAQRLDDHAARDYEAATSRATFDLVEWLQRGAEFVVPGGIVIGFEAVPRTDLPTAIERHSYSLGDKQRAIVIAHRSTG
jgi:16S rRNA (guanine527-N7)-methyltransferase